MWALSFIATKKASLQRFLFKFLKVGLASIILAIFVLSQNSLTVWALTQAQKDTILSGARYFNTEEDEAVQCSAGIASTAAGKGSVYFFGDSLTVGMKSAGLEQKVNATGRTVAGVEATVGISVPATVDKIQKYDQQDKAKLTSAGTVVVALGTNDGGPTGDAIGQSGFTSRIQAMIKEIKSANSKAQIYWMNAYKDGSPSAYGKVNAAISSNSSSSGYQVIDWYGEASSNNSKYAPFSAGVHPDAHYAELADFVVSSLGAGGSSVTSSAGCACAVGTTNLTGSDNETRVWNYFKGKGLSDEQTAGIMGNMRQESSFNPVDMQIGGESQDPYDAKDLGWGIIQWSGNGTTGRSTGDKFMKAYNESGVQGEVYELATQLDLVWQHMNEHPPITNGFDLTHFKTLTDVNKTTEYFRAQVEAGTDPGGVRETFAQGFLTKYKGSATGTPVPGGCGTSATPNCQTAVGVAKILCAAKVYDPVSYVLGGGHQGAANWHKDCPVVGPSCSLDCSSLVSVAVYDVFGVDLNQDTKAQVVDTKDWQHISFSQLQPGDLVQPNPDHVAIVDHVEGGNIYTFAAHTSNAPQPDQVGPSSAPYTDDGNNVYLHYIGPGSGN